MAKWYENLKWRCLVDMHIPDWHQDFLSKFNSKEYAENMEIGGVELSELYTGNCLGICFFPTRVGHQHKAFLGKDMTKETLAALKGEKMIYFNIWSRWAFDTHPDWRMVDADGHNSLWKNGEEASRFGTCCINSDGYKEYVRQQITQLVTDYPSKGLWIDMLGWFGMLCHCDDCKEKFRKQTGLAIPKDADWNVSEWAKFMRFREESVTDFAKMIVDTAKGINPEISVVFNCAAWQSNNMFGGFDESFLAMNEYLAGDFYGNSLAYSTICRALNNLSPHKPIEFMTSRCIELEDHTTIKSKEELRNSVYASIAHNAAFVMIDAINPDGTMEKEVYQNLGEIKKEVAPLYEFWNPKAKMMADVLFYTNLKSGFNPRERNFHYLKCGNMIGGHLGVLAKGMIKEHIPYDFIFKPNLEDAVKTKKTIVLSDVFILDEEEVNLFTEFVKNGGNLIVTGLTGMFDKEKGRRDNFALAEMMGVNYKGETEFDFSYFNPIASKLFEGYSKSAPMISYSSSAIVEADKAEVMATLTLPCSHSLDAHKYSSAISNPPREHTDYPAVTIHQYGKGKVMYIASPFECDEKDAQQKVFANHIKYMMNEEPFFTTNAPGWMDVFVYDDGDGRYRVVLLQAMEQYYECEVHDIKVSVKLKGITKGKSARTGKELPVEQTQDGITVSIPKMKDFEIISLS